MMRINRFFRMHEESISLSTQQQATYGETRESKYSLLGDGKSLSQDALNNIFSFLPSNDLRKCNLVNKSFDACINQTMYIIELRFDFRKGNSVEACIHKLKKISTLTLKLTVEGLTKENVKVIVDALKNNKSIKYIDLDLSGNKFGDGGAQVLANVEFPTLTKLSLRDTDICDTGIQYLANGNLPNLNTLDLQYNEIGDDGAQYLVEGSLPSLTNLNLSFNNIKDDGAQALANGNFPNLTKLNLIMNRISDIGVQSFANGTLLYTVMLSREFVRNWRMWSDSNVLLEWDGPEGRFYEMTMSS